MTLIEQGISTNARATPARRMTETEFETWAFAENARAEWVDGNVIHMSPVNYDHADLIAWLIQLLGFHAAKHNLGKVLGPEYMTRLSDRRRIPDILFVTKANESRLHKTYLDGAPDLIIEVVSPDSQSRDWREKYLDYQSNGVKEYWVIDPNSAHAEFYTLIDKVYVRMSEENGVVHSQSVAGFWLRVDWLWQKPLPNTYETAKILGIF